MMMETLVMSCVIIASDECLFDDVGDVAGADDTVLLVSLKESLSYIPLNCIVQVNHAFFYGFI